MLNTFENLNLALLNVGFSEMNANWNWKSIYSPFARIYYVKEGRAETYINGKAYALNPGHLYLTPPFTLHDDACHSYFSLYYIHFYESAIHKESLFDKYDFPVAIAATPLDLLLTERLMQINPDRYLRHFDPKLYDNAPTLSRSIAENNKMATHIWIETKGILCQLISKFLKTAQIKPAQMDMRINKSLQYIHENADKDISVARLADISCVTEDHFIRIFKKEMNYTPLKYVNMKKIEKAQLLLLTTNMPIRDIALELSIDNISYFSRMFKQNIGMTPGEYREKHNNQA